MKSRRQRSLAPHRDQIDQLAVLLRAAEPTPFVYEGEAIMHLRATRCMDGWPYAAADETARRIVEEALLRIGAMRPSWSDGQPIAIADMSETCAICGAPLYGSYETRFCSHRCETRARVMRRAEESAERRKGLACAHCGTLFDARVRSDQIYCSTTCSVLAGRQKRDYIPARDLATDHVCLWCGTSFRRYAPPGRPARFCSSGCGTRWRWANKGIGPRKLRAASAECSEKPGSNVGG